MKIPRKIMEAKNYNLRNAYQVNLLNAEYNLGTSARHLICLLQKTKKMVLTHIHEAVLRQFGALCISFRRGLFVMTCLYLSSFRFDLNQMGLMARYFLHARRQCRDLTGIFLRKLELCKNQCSYKAPLIKCKMIVKMKIYADLA